MEKYSEIKKNTVDSASQLKDTEIIRFFNVDGKGIRVMFVGNSITLHGIKHDIGWHNEWGMAASAKENDYVHLLMEKIKDKDGDASFCICQVSGWEGAYKNGQSLYSLFEPARDFNADIVIARFIENCPCADFDAGVFKKEYKSLLNYLSAKDNTQVILTTSFWHHPGDSVICQLAEEFSLPLVKLNDLGSMPEMKAIGLFEHSGVANHPGDLGMKTIAERIFDSLEKYL